MNMAAALGLTDGKYAFLTIDFANNAKIVSNWTHNRALDGRSLSNVLAVYVV